MNNYQEKNNELWLEKYECAKQYYVENGNLLIPGTYKTNDGVKLGMWISRQRRDYINNKLSNDRIELLEAIGMIWSVYDAQWFDYYKLAVKYYNENGNLLISRLYTTSNGIKLGSWLGAQRRQYKDGKLSKDKTELLEKIGMIWSVYEIQWYENYQLAVEYYNDNGNLLVPLRYKTTSNIKLGSWISGQRRNFKAGRLSADKIKLLERIGMVWDGPSEIWKEMYKLAQQYYEENKNLSISSTSFTYKNASLGSWIVTQRKNYSQGILTEKQITLLNEIGMEWVYSNNPEHVWEKNYNTVLDFYSKYKHLYIPIGYVTEDGVRLGVWLYDR